MYTANITTDDTSGNYVISTSKVNETATTDSFVAFDVFFKVNSDKEVVLTTDSAVSHKATAAVGTDKGLKNAGRVGFVKLGHGNSEDNQATLIALSNEVASKAYIWEPNAEAHSAYVTNSVAAAYGVTIPGATAAKPGIITTYGIKGEIPDTAPQDLVQVVNGTKNTHTTAMTYDIVTNSSFTANQTFMTLKAGVTKVRIYMWIEGQDLDCENNASGSDISFTLTFEAPTGTSSNP